MFKSLLLCLLGVVAWSNCAAAGAPCTPLDANFKAGQIVRNDDGSCLVWFCSANHLWNTWTLCSAYSGITGAMVDHLRATFQYSQAQRDAEWAAVMANPPAAGSAEDKLVALALTQHPPLDPPIDGWVVQNVKAYKQRIIKNGYQLVQYGTVPLGTPCDAAVKLNDATLGFVNAVDVAAVTRTVKLDPLPAALYAKCSQ